MEEKILKELENINVQLKQMNQRFDGIDQKFEKTEDRIVTTLRDEFDKKLSETIEAISADVGTQINELCVKIEERDNREHSKILNELREHKRRTKRGVEAFGRILVWLIYILKVLQLKM